MSKRGRAADILEGLRGVPPQHATEKTVVAYEKAVKLLAGEPGSDLWYEALFGLGSHLLESPHGNRGANTARARECYRAAMDMAEQTAPERWPGAASGYANSLASDPSAGTEDLEVAIELFGRLEETYVAAGALEPLVVTLGQAASAVQKLPRGDPRDNFERALGLRQRAVRLLAECGPEFAALRGRARHNLGVMYAHRETGLRSQNVDRAVRLLQAALEDRPADTDPVGRARTLRSLASVYPEWSGTEFMDEGYELAEDAMAEARLIEKGDAAARSRTTGWARFEREQSALYFDLDAVVRRLRQDYSQAANWFEEVITHHQEALEAIPRESMPYKWAEWMAGLGAVLGRMPALGEHRNIDEAHRCFEEALAAFDPTDRPQLGRHIYARWAEFSHEMGDFERSFTAYRAALDLSDLVLASTVDPDHRLAEIASSRGYGLFSAYAAARLSRTEEAVVLAERERMRNHAPLLRARDGLRRPGAARQEILDGLDRIRHLEQELARLDDLDSDAQQENMAGRLAGFLGVDISMISIRRVDEDADEPSEVADDRARIRAELAGQHAKLQRLLPTEPVAEAERMNAVSEIVAVARDRGVTLVYLLGTVHGMLALVVLPDGRLDQIRFDDVDSDVTLRLLHGDDDTPGFLEAVRDGDPGALNDCVETIRAALQPTVFDRLTSALLGHGTERAALIPLGRLGLLPLHVAAGDFVYSYAPSASVLRTASTFAPRDRGLLLVADPGHDDTETLPMSIAEARTIVALAGHAERVSMLVGPQATRDAVRRASGDAGVIHFGCHGLFRPALPLDSELQLAADHLVTVADMFSGEVDLRGAQLVSLLACATAAGDAQRVPDECLSFPSAVLVGGALAAVSTMWPVDDWAAALFSVKFHELIRQGMRPAEAVVVTRAWLRSATPDELLGVVERMRSALAAETDAEAAAALGELATDLAHSRSAHPFGEADLWAPFVLTGG